MNLDRIKKETTSHEISFFKSIDSTNRYLVDHGKCSEICISNEQSAGRGRRGNTWVSPDSGNLYFSLCWCFNDIPEYWSLLGLLVGIATAETLDELGLKGHGIKWPNDIFWKKRKMGGILIETINQTGKVVIGIGLNLNISKKDQLKIDQPIVDLNTAMQGKFFLKDDLVIILINNLHHHLKNFEHLNTEQFIKSWKRWDILYGQTVNLVYQEEKLTGQVKGIDTQGRLRFIEDCNNSVENKEQFFTSADIKLKIKQNKT